VQDIDKLDGDNELAVVDYIDDIYTYYKIAQVTTNLPSSSDNMSVQLTSTTVLKLLANMCCDVLQHESRPVDYMGSQPEINPKMRAILVDWLVEVAHKFELMPESFYLTIYIIDRFLSLQAVSRRELQLVGVSAMLIACKYEEIWAPQVGCWLKSSSDCV
jgi:cyclin B